MKLRLITAETVGGGSCDILYQEIPHLRRDLAKFRIDDPITSVALTAALAQTNGNGALARIFRLSVVLAVFVVLCTRTTACLSGRLTIAR